MPQGKLYGIGVGPGDPELLTLKAKRILEEVPVLLVPKSRRGKRSLALSVVKDYVREDPEQVEIVLPMTREKTVLEEHWRLAASQVITKLNEGKDCAFITLGDPSTYSTFSYLLRYVLFLDGQVEVELVPGVSAIHAAASWTQEPLAEGEESVVIIPASRPVEELERALERFDNLVILKAGRYMDKIINLLESGEKRRKSIIVSRMGFDDAFWTSDLANLKSKKFDYLSTIIIKRERGREGP